jgi:UDP:flavonoid glycosyltransferase YjiC (YdhE family)
MGHVTRDIAIARELHRQNPWVEISWLAHPLAAKALQHAGEKLLSESGQSADYNKVGRAALDGFSLNLMKYIEVSRQANEENVRLFNQVIARYQFNLVIGDESFEVVEGMDKGEINLNTHMILIEDFIGIRAMTKNPLEILGVYLNNRNTVAQIPRLSSRITRFFVGEIEDIPDETFGLFLPKQREFAKKNYHFLGHVLRFNPALYTDWAAIKAKLGYGKEPLLICATGGTFAGKEMLEICGKAYPILKKEIPDLHMVCVCGELYGSKPPELPAEVEFYCLLPDLHEHYAACDMAVVVGGGTTTIELTALRRPFIFFPLEKQFDQQYIAERQAQLGAGIEMRYFKTTPEALAQTIISHIGKDVGWKPISTNGAQKAAQLIDQLFLSKAAP